MYVTLMHSVFHIPSSSAPYSGERENLSASLIARILMWLESFCGFHGEASPRKAPALPPRADLTRYQRLHAARYKRRPCPVSRSTAGLRPLIPNAAGHPLSPTQYLERETKLSSMGRFQIYNWLYYRWEFWRRGAVKLRARLGTARAQCLALCGAPLSPD